MTALIGMGKEAAEATILCGQFESKEKVRRSGPVSLQLHF
jgi:hypothetical protein